MAFAVTYFRFPFRRAAFWLIFVSLMLPIEVRIVPTYELAANAALPWNAIVEWLDLEELARTLTGRDAKLTFDLSLVNSYTGLILPLARLGDRDLPVPAVLPHGARGALRRGAGRRARPMQFFWMVLLPLSRTHIVAMAIILFLWAWNQYLWPLLITTDKAMATTVIGLRQLMPTADAAPSLARPDGRAR